MSGSSGRCRMRMQVLLAEQLRTRKTSWLAERRHCRTQADSFASVVGADDVNWKVVNDGAAPNRLLHLASRSITSLVSVVFGDRKPRYIFRNSNRYPV